jgi:gluconate/galactonate dehydratase
VHAGEFHGTGEASPSPGLKGCEAALKAILVGEDAFKVNRIEEKLRHASLFAGTSFYSLISAVNIALHDLIGKYVNVPVWRLIGGDREQIRVYVDAHAGSSFEAINSLLTPIRTKRLKKITKRDEYELESNPVLGRLTAEEWSGVYSPESYAKRASEMLKAGYTALKFDLDVPTPYTKQYNRRSGEVTLKEADYMREIVGSARESIGNETELAVDLHWRYGINSVLRICRALEPYGLRWVEDPTPATKAVSNLDELRMITSRTSIPIATGENICTAYHFKDLLKTGVLVWTPDLTKAGGITEGRRIAEMAAMYDIEFSPHNISSPLGTMAAAHACSLSNSFGALEFHCHGFPGWYEMAKSKTPIIDKGFIGLTEEPGLGLELDERYMRKNWSFFAL